MVLRLHANGIRRVAPPQNSEGDHGPQGIVKAGEWHVVEVALLLPRMDRYQPCEEGRPAPGLILLAGNCSDFVRNPPLSKATVIPAYAGIHWRGAFPSSTLNSYPCGPPLPGRPTADVMSVLAFGFYLQTPRRDGGVRSLCVRGRSIASPRHLTAGTHPI